MTEDVKLQESVKKTQDLLGKYIKKPPLTDKLLKKPPFRFIHDIISSIIKETGFLKNLFNEEELNSSNYTDKDAKLAYLTKLIDAVKLITGHELSVRPSKIISGQEPIKTNELFHAIGRALDKKVSSDEAIEFYKNNQQKKKDGSLKKSKPNSQSSGNEKLKKSIKKSSSSEKLSSGSKDKMKDIKDRSKEKISKEKSSSKDKIKEKDNKDKEKINKEKKESRILSRDSKTRESRKKESNDASSKVTKSQIVESHKEKPKKKKEINEPKDQLILTEDIKSDEVINTQSGKIEESTLIEPSEKNEVKNGELPIDGNVGISTSDLPFVGNEEHNKMPQEMNKAQENIENVEKKIDEPVEKPVEKRAKSALLRPPSARPPSARPAAPRIRNKPDFIVNNNVMTQMADINVIVENFDMKEDDAEDMVVVETANIEDNLPINGIDLLNNPQIGQEHGHLVAQILETQRDLVNEGNVEIIPNKVEIEWDSGMKKDRDLVVKEIDKLRGTIQMLTRATNPLGKLFDFLQEDVEIMQRELSDWRNQFTGIREQLIIERNNTNEILKPLEDSLKEVEANINNQIEKIHQTKCNILKNNQKISRLLSGQ